MEWPPSSWLLHAALSYIRGVRGVEVHFLCSLLLGTKVLSDKSRECLVLSLKRLTSITDKPTYRFQALLLLLLLLLLLFKRLCQPTEQSQLSEADSCLFCS